ncbi:MAG: hypothetical protein LBL19_08495, partial [Spirochaetaceae bacterium]|nr:hypothetical protein [Spirochaetaceae bacterium]
CLIPYIRHYPAPCFSLGEQILKIRAGFKINWPCVNAQRCRIFLEPAFVFFQALYGLVNIFLGSDFKIAI